MRTQIRSFAKVGLLASATLVVSLALAACNTVKGAGEDLKSAGEAGEKAISGDK
ncbi:MAG: entericidin A/B family lipoprotein [Phycisphaeraceae bacterium]|nr:entericidin A/B family lipoprotein [Phycisphaeraceae bacterium]